MSAPFPVGAKVRLTSNVWGTRDLFTSGPFVGDVVTITRTEGPLSYFRDGDVGGEWIVESNGAWAGVQILDRSFPRLTTRRERQAWKIMIDFHEPANFENPPHSVQEYTRGQIEMFADLFGYTQDDKEALTDALARAVVAS